MNFKDERFFEIEDSFKLFRGGLRYFRERKDFDYDSVDMILELFKMVNGDMFVFYGNDRY